MPVLNDYLNQRYGGFTNQGVAENRIDTWGPLARYNATSVRLVVRWTKRAQGLAAGALTRSIPMLSQGLS